MFYRNHRNYIDPRDSAATFAASRPAPIAINSVVARLTELAEIARRLLPVKQVCRKGLNGLATQFPDVTTLISGRHVPRTNDDDGWS
jgi:hypothetical protein